MHESDDDISGIFDAPGETLSADERANTIAGRYVIEERIGAGGMGQVLRVRHRRLGKRFALKLMLAEFSLEPEARAIFHREARLASALSHPNIVEIVDFGEDPDWGLFIVMEYLQGDLLSQRIEQYGTLPLPVVCMVAAQLADALAHSHASDVVHGDLKSENVLCVSPSGGDRRKWQVKLLDFGTARVTSATGGPQARVAGTPGYIAPERIAGGPPHPSADIYALGVILYEMLAGTVPFPGSDPAETLRRQMTEAHEPVGARRGEVLDVRLDSIVDRALARSPADRYPDARSLARDLTSYMDELGMRLRASGIESSTVRHGRRTAAAAAAFDGLGVPAVGLWSDGRIAVANVAFTRLVRVDDPAQLEGESILDVPLWELSRELREDLRLVAVNDKVVRRRITIRTGDREVSMRCVMTPATGNGGHCILVLHSIPRVPD